MMGMSRYWAGSRRTFSRSTNDVQDSRAQLRMPPGVFGLLAAFIIHFFFSCAPSFEPRSSEASSGGDISCIATRKSGTLVYGTEKAREVSCEMVKKELEELGRSVAEMLLGILLSEGAELIELESGKTRVTRAISCAFWRMLA